MIAGYVCTILRFLYTPFVLATSNLQFPIPADMNNAHGSFELSKHCELSIFVQFALSARCCITHCRTTSTLAVNKRGVPL